MKNKRTAQNKVNDLKFILAVNGVKEKALEPVLCLIKNEKAFFTYVPLSEQWGDDWSDKPYQDNAGYPYEYPNYPLPLMVAWYDADLILPEQQVYQFDYGTMIFSVEEINQKKVPWLRSFKYHEDNEILRKGIEIWAGTPLSEFIRKIRNAYGKVYREDKRVYGF